MKEEEGPRSCRRGGSCKAGPEHGSKEGKEAQR